jgi:hypothetical protein
MNPFAYLFNFLRLGEESTIDEFLRLTSNSFIEKTLQTWRTIGNTYRCNRQKPPTLGTNRESGTFLHEQTDSI